MIGSASRGTLRALLLEGYADLKRRLTRRLGSSEAASDVLHDTYLRLERLDAAGPVANPRAYLLRMALNVASDHEKAGKRLLTAVEVEELWRMGDEAIDPEAIVAGRLELALFLEALEELPKRTQEILMWARVDNLPHEAIAERLGLSTRMVQLELRRALEHCAQRLDRKIVQRFGPPARKKS